MKTIVALLLALLIASPAAAVTLATDNFTGADANPIGGNWTTIAGGLADLQRASNKARGTNTALNNGAFYNAVSAPNDQWSRLLIVAASSFSPCPVVRVDAGADSFYGVCGFSVGADIDLHKHVAGVYTSLSALVSPWAVNDTLKVQAQGTTIKGFVNDIEVASVTDASLAAGQFGIVIPGASPLTNIEADDWSGGDFTSGSVLRRRTIVVD